MCRRGIVLRGERAQDTMWLRSHCGCYSCEECAKINVLRHKLRILSFLRLHDSEVFFETYTAHENARTFEDSVANLRLGLKRVLQQKRNVLKSAGTWVKVWELHASGRAHVHMLTTITLAKHFRKRGSFDVARLNDFARGAGMGYQARAVKVTNLFGAASYVTKYMTKAAHEARFPRHFRRIEFSRDFPELESEFDEARDWENFLKASLLQIDMRLRADLSSTKRVVNRKKRAFTNEDVIEILPELYAPS